MSPVSKKKLGRAYVALARSHSEKFVCKYFVDARSVLTVIICHRGNLQLALDFYKKAELYVPDNIKLKERWDRFFIIIAGAILNSCVCCRIIEIDWSMKHGTKYVPEPKKKKKGKEKSSKSRQGKDDEDEPMKGPFGEATNTKAIITPQAHKRGRSTNMVEGGDVEMMQTPAKRQRRRKGAACADGDSDDDDDYEDAYQDQGKTPARRTRARAQAQAEVEGA